MYATFFSCSDDKRKLNKSMSNLGGYDCKVKEPCSLEAPTIILTAVPGGFKQCNYCYLSDFQRYYFIKDFTILTGNRIAIDLEIDVLQSFNDQIASVFTIIKRNEFINSKKITDRELPIRSERTISRMRVGSLGNTESIVLTVTGGEG